MISHQANDPRYALETAILRLDPDWIVMANLALDGERADYLLLHPRRGVALVDRGAHGGDPAAALRARLARERFEEFFPGNLPIVHQAIADTGEPLAQRLDAAFATAAPLTLGDADWVDAVSLLVTARQAPRPWIGPPVPIEPAAEPAFTPAMFAQSARGEVAASPPPAYLGPRLPRWQSVAAVVSLGTFAALWFLLPSEIPAPAPATVSVAIAPAPEPPAPQLAEAPPAPDVVPPAAVPAAPAPANPAEPASPAPANPAPVEPKPEAEEAAVPPHPPEAPPRPRAQTTGRFAALPSLEVPERPVLEEALSRPSVTPVSDLIHRNCRPYSSSVTFLGKRQSVIGLACQAKDGSWQLVSEAPVRP